MTRMEIDPATLKIKDKGTLFSEKEQFQTISQLYAHMIFDDMRFSTRSGLYRYDNHLNRMMKDEILESILNPDITYSKITSIDSTIYALSPDIIQVISLSDGKPVETKKFPFDISQIDFRKDYEMIIPVEKNLAIIPNEHGFAILNTDSPVSGNRKNLFIQNVYTSYPKDSLIYTDNLIGYKPESEIPYDSNSLRFEYAVRSFGQSAPIEYRYRLIPDELWSEPTTATVKEYSNLYEGNYRFEVEMLHPDGTATMESFSFTILPPWYRSIYAWISYILIILALFYCLYKWEDRRIARKHIAAIARKEQEMILKEKEYDKERMRKEQEIIALQNEKLEQELTFKSQEMANLMINFSRKNEILLYIKQELSKITGEMKGDGYVKLKRMLLALNNNIDSNIASDDALKRFEEQFNLVHNNFMKKVREKHPDLSTSEIKMCAYVKMGLSSKEMAPLLNISIRGAETLRYRLRKKMGLEREDSLTEYLNSFS